MGEFVAELWAFMKERKKFWLLPILLVETSAEVLHCVRVQTAER